MCRYSWHSAGSLGWPFPTLNIYISNKVHGNNAVKQHSETVKWFEMTKMLIAVLGNKFIVSFIIIFGTLSFPVGVVSPG